MPFVVPPRLPQPAIHCCATTATILGPSDPCACVFVHEWHSLPLRACVPGPPFQQIPAPLTHSLICMPAPTTRPHPLTHFNSFMHSLATPRPYPSPTLPSQCHCPERSLSPPTLEELCCSPCCPPAHAWALSPPLPSALLPHCQRCAGAALPSSRQCITCQAAAETGSRNAD